MSPALAVILFAAGESLHVSTVVENGKPVGRFTLVGTTVKATALGHEWHGRATSALIEKGRGWLLLNNRE